MDIQPRLRRRQRNERNEWELPFADMMTLLLCFFIVALTVSSVDEQRFTEVAQSMTTAMGKKKVEQPARPEPVEPQPQVPKEWRQKLKSLGEVRADLEQRIGTNAEAVDLAMRPDAVAVNLRGGVFFASGRADLTQRARAVLHSMAPALMDIPYRVKVEGHTDNIPISSSRFPSNWELSASRASAVARFFIDKGVPAERMEVVGLADTRPEAPNEDLYGRAIPENQARNRRIVILVTP